MLILNLIIAGLFIYFVGFGFFYATVYCGIKDYKERKRKEKEESERKARQEARINESRRKCWDSLPAFYESIPRQNLIELLRALDNYEWLNKKYPTFSKLANSGNMKEIIALKSDFMEDAEKYSGKSRYDFVFVDLHIKYIKEKLGVQLY